MEIGGKKEKGKKIREFFKKRGKRGETNENRREKGEREEN